MTVLPIAERELRVAARRRNTYWTRVIAAVLAMATVAAFLILWELEPAPGMRPGQVLFQILRWLCFAGVSLAGIILTSDCLSEEKREGTIGLLFLTDLRGYDIVSGKLMATTLRSFYTLVALAPVLAIPMLMGGVSGKDFWQTILALCNALFFSVSAGILISVISHDALKAMSGTLLLCAIFLAGPPLLDLWRADWNPIRFSPKWLYADPVWAMLTISSFSTTGFWKALAVPHAIGWVFLVIASLLAPRTWQEKSNTRSNWWTRLSRRWRLASKKRRLKWLAGNAVVWLAGRDLWLTRCAAVVLLGLAGLADYLYHKMSKGDFRDFMIPYTGLLIFLLYLWTSAQASRFFVEARRNGTLELLLCTPVRVGQILRAQWIVLLKMLVIPVMVILAMQTALMLLYLQTYSRSTSQHFEDQRIIAILTGVVELFTSLLALGWFGMWMGVRTQRPNLAVIKTLGFVIILPWLVWMFLLILCDEVISTGPNGAMPRWSIPIYLGALNLLKDSIFIFWGWRSLVKKLRQSAAREEMKPTGRWWRRFVPRSLLASHRLGQNAKPFSPSD